MTQVLRYFHQDPKKSVQSSSTQLIITQMSLSIRNNTQTLEDKQNTIPGKSLSSNDFTDYYKNKLKGIEEEAEVNVQANWDENDSTADSYIQNKPGIDTVVTEDSNNLITSGAVFNAIDELPEPMIFKGSLGTGGTIQVLPTADNTNVGYTYKVITAGTYDGKTAKPGDTYISDGTEWILIPSGDEPNGTVTNVAMTVPTGLSVSGSPITTSGTLAITYAVGYAIPTLTDQATWTAKQDAISDLSTIRSRADEGHTAYGWGNHANAGYLMAISDLATIRSRADEGHTAYGWGDHSLAGYQAAISDLATIRSRSDEGHTAYGWGDHSQAGYVKSSGVTSVSMTVPTGLSISGSPITTTGTLALSFANGYSIPTTTKLSNWDTAYGWGDHSVLGYLKSITKAMVTTALGYTPPTQDTNTTYTISTGDSNGLIKVTPSSGSAYNVGVKGWTSWLPLIGGTVTGTITIDKSNIDFTKSDNGVTSTVYPGFFIRDKNGKLTGRLFTAVSPNGKLTTYLYSNNYDTNGNSVGEMYLGLEISKDGTKKWVLTDAASFREALGLGTNATSSTAYLPLAGGTMTGTPYINMPAKPATIADSQPFGITYGKIQCYGSLLIAADTDGSTTEYVNITSGYGISNATAENGLSVGYTTLKWKGENIWHAGNLKTMIASGTNHAGGLVPDTPSTAGTSKFLREDGSWSVPSYTTNTDKNVTQTVTTSNNTDYRPILIGYSSSGSSSPTFTTVTNTAFATHKIYIKPSTGDLKSNGDIDCDGSLKLAKYIVFSAYPGHGSGTCTMYYNQTSKLIRFDAVTDINLSGKKVWHEDNDGSSSGLDADLLDGQHGSYYATASALGNYLPLTGGTLSLSAIDSFKINKTSNSLAYILFYGKVNGTSNTLLGWLGLNGVDSPIFRPADQSADYKLWHQGNDGSGSGLDADLLDGQHGSYYATASSVTTLQGYFYTGGIAKTARRLPVGYGYDGGSGATNPYHLMGEATAGGTGPRNITAVFLVSSYYGHSRGILFVLGRVDSGSTIQSNTTHALWIVRDKNLDPSRFILTTKVTSNSLTCRLYYKVRYTWEHARITLLDDGTLATPVDYWTLYNTSSDTAGDYIFASIPSGETLFVSVDNTSSKYSDTATNLSTVSKTLWGNTYWTSGGVPTSIGVSGSNASLSYVDNISMGGKVRMERGNGGILFYLDSTNGYTTAMRMFTGSTTLSLGYETTNTAGYDTNIYGKNIATYVGSPGALALGLYIKSNTYVGIGKSPSYKLDVDGTAKADSLYIGENLFTTTSNYLTIACKSNEVVLAGDDTTMYFNYRTYTGKTIPTTFKWNAGASNAWAAHDMGSLTARGTVDIYPTGSRSFTGVLISHSSSFEGPQIVLDPSCTDNAIGTGTDYSVIALSKTDGTMYIRYPAGKTLSVGPFNLSTSYGYFNSSGGWTGPSDASLKKDIYKPSKTESHDIWEWLVEKGFKRFTWINTEKHDIGAIAQEVLEILPEVVDYNESTKLYGLDYTKLHSHAISSIVQELKDTKEEIKLLQALIAELKLLLNN